MQCSRCSSIQIYKNSWHDGKQNYLCQYCDAE
ncbi:IS1/IS1595 family N-terminal zinc-binding domain-containing protein [Cylindrospermum sp. FACHB-282]